MPRRSDRDPFCLCEYENTKGERSHLLATFCDCEAVDLLCDSILRCQPISEEKIRNVAETIEDRMRLPFVGGAVKIRPDVISPFILLPLSLAIGANGFYWTIFGIIFFLSSLWMLGKLFEHKNRHQLYYSTTKATLATLMLIFMTFVVGFRKVLLWEVMLIVTLFLVTMWYFRGARRNPGYISSNIYEHLDGHDLKAVPLQESEVTWIDSRPIIDGYLQTECDRCGIKRPPRSGHCPRCERCVKGRDHHCIWLDTCIGQHNHRPFFLFLVFLFATGCYGVHLTSTTICTPEIYLDWFLYASDCRFLYSDFPTGLCASAAWFTAFDLLAVFLLLLQQSVYISQNITSLEMVKARRMGRSRFAFLAVNNVNYRGFFRNWADFLGDRRGQKYPLHF